jgi:hypothetical protein
MKLVLILAASLLSFCTSVSAQNRKLPPPPPPPNFNRDSLPYKLNPDLPVFNILLKDSVTTFNSFNIPKGRPVALMLFSPDCKHCSEAMDAITHGMDSLKNIRFYLMTLSPDMAGIRKFYKEHNLDKFENIEAVGWDYDFFYLTFFGAMQVPDIALYNSEKKLVHFFEPPFTVSQIFEKVHQHH